MAAPEVLAAARAAIRIADRRARLLEKLRRALLKNDDRRALMLARRLAGLEERDAEEDDRPAAGVH